jgi:flagellar hook-associated protein 2
MTSSVSTSTSSVSGLVSGMDTTTLITQLMQIEAQPQAQLKTQLANTQTDAAAYRDINTSFAALATAAGALTKTASWGLTKATSSDDSITATTTAGAASGSLTFTVDKLATAHSVMATTTWQNSTDPYSLGSTLTVKSTDGTKTFGTIAVTSSTTGAASLDDAVTAINKSGLGLSAVAVKTTSGYALQVTSIATGAAKGFQIQSDTDPTGAGYAVATQAVDAAISFANPNPSTPGARFTSTSASNTFSDVLGGTSFTVSQLTAPNTTATVTVASDPDAISSKVSAVVNAANAVLAKIKQYTDSSSGSTAALKGDYSLSQLSGRVLNAVSSAVGTTLLDADGKKITSSAGSNGVQLTSTGTLTFDATAFKKALTTNPTLAQSIFGGSLADGADGVPNTADDTMAVDGVGSRLLALATQASDTATGMLTSLAKGQDTRAKDIQSQIDSWTTRLAARQATLTAQFTAMETALGTLKNQSSWLTSQINSLPSMSKSN